MANIYFSAHQDDDLIFMSPALMDDVASGLVWTVYLTAGDAGLSEDYWRAREEGERAAYTAMGAGSWRDDPLRVGDRMIASSVSSRSYRLVFLRLPDGGRLIRSEKPSRALERLLTGERIKTVDGSMSYDRGSLLSVLAQLIQSAGRGVVSTHDPDGWVSGCDHIDHLYTGLIAVEAAHTVGATTRLYCGYCCDLKPQNIPDCVYHRKRAIFEEYARHDPMIPSPLDHQYEDWLRRSYLRPSDSTGY